MFDIPGYGIERVLGRGGMATVYLAEQASLRRKVALKILDARVAAEAQFVDRFLREGRIAASLRHRHIVPVHDVGRHGDHVYLAMEYLPRGSLAGIDGTLAPVEVLRCVREIAGALDAAHRRGIVHRDVKPGNILRHEDGAFLLADFGIARVLGSASVVTGQGFAVGTPAYMSPEQWRDEPLDGRSDLYSLGVVMYRLLCGRLPFDAADGWSLGMQHMNAPIPRLPASLQPLQSLLEALLAKAPADRPASAADVARRAALLERELDPEAARATLPPPPRALDARALASLFRTGPKPRSPSWKLGAALVAVTAVAIASWQLAPSREATPSPEAATAGAIAVLPCKNWLPDPALEWLGEGFAEQVTHRLSRLAGLSVIDSRSALAVGASGATSAEIGERLGAGLLVSCSLVPLGGDIRIAAELIDARDNAQRWSVQLDRKSADLLGAVDELAVAIAERLLANLVGTERAELVRHDTHSLEALKLYREAILLSEQWTPAATRDAETRLRRALELDPGFARAHAAEAQLWMNRLQVDNLSWPVAGPRIDAALEKALRHDPGLGEALALRCHRRMFLYDWQGARDDCDRAVLAAPNSGRVHYLVGQFHFILGLDGAVEHELRFRELEPENPFAWHNVSAAYTWTGNPLRGLQEAELALRRFPAHGTAHLMRAFALREMDRCAEAADAIDRLAEAIGDNPEFIGIAAEARACAGELESAESIRTRMLAARASGAYVPDWHFAALEARLGHLDAAMEHLEAGHRNGDMWSLQAMALQIRATHPLHALPRYRVLRERYAFPGRGSAGTGG